MGTCQETANYLHSLGISDQKLGDACGVTRVYMNMIRAGRYPGSEDLQAKLDSLYEQAIARNIPIKHSMQHAPRKPTIQQSIIIEAIPSTGYSTSQEVMPYVPQEEEAPKNRLAPRPTFPPPISPNKPQVGSNKPQRAIRNAAWDDMCRDFIRLTKRFKQATPPTPNTSLSQPQGNPGTQGNIAPVTEQTPDSSWQAPDYRTYRNLP